MLLQTLKTASWPQIAEELRAIARIAVPMMLAQLIQVAAGVVDTIMAGHVSTNDLAAVSLGATVFITLYVTLLGVVTALNPILSHHLGAKRFMPFLWTARQGIWLGLLTGLFGAVVAFICAPLLKHFLPLPADVTSKAELFVIGIALGMPAAMLHRALYAYAFSLGLTKPVVIVSLGALLINIPLNYLLIHGLFGFPKMGGAGCGWATSVALWLNAIVLFWYICKHKSFRDFPLWGRFGWPDWKMQKSFLALGIPMALSFFVEVSLFSFIALLITSLGTMVVATHQIAFNFSSIVYLIPQGIATAMAIRVGHHNGARHPVAAQFTAAVGLMLGIGVSIVMMVIVFGFRREIIGWYTSDEQVIALGSVLLLFVALYQLADAIQTIASGALRGYKLTTIPMFIHVTSFWLFGLGLGIVLGLTDWIVSPMGVKGFWLALIISLSIAAVLLMIYLANVSRAHIETTLGKRRGTVI